MSLHVVDLARAGRARAPGVDVHVRRVQWVVERVTVGVPWLRCPAWYTPVDRR